MKACLYPGLAWVFLSSKTLCHKALHFPFRPWQQACCSFSVLKIYWEFLWGYRGEYKKYACDWGMKAKKSDKVFIITVLICSSGLLPGCYAQVLRCSHSGPFLLLHHTLCFLSWVHIFQYARQDHSCLPDSSACQDRGNLLNHLKSHQKSETTDVWNNRSISSLSRICYKCWGLAER